MSAPSSAHESRLAELEDLATLAGFTVDVRLRWRLRPDVARVCPANGAVFLGDAKATESPTCSATRRRLRWYATALASLPDEVPVTVALAVPADADAAGWAYSLVGAVKAHLDCESPTLLAIGGTVVVATRAHRRLSSRDRAYREWLWPAETDNVPCARSTSSAAEAA